MARPIITLTTDFGTSDPFVGSMKGVILRICPDADIVDLTHDVPAQDIRAGAYLFSTSCAHFPQGTTHVIVVDPGVGTERRPIAAQSRTATFVCPDNGLLSYVLAEPGPWKTRHLTNPNLWLPNISSTFHGRDIFAPVAAHLAAGAPFDSVGPTIDHPVTFEIREPKISDGQVLGEVIHVDRYGNLITNITGESLSVLSARDAPLVSSRQGEATRDLVPSEAPAILITIADREIAGLSKSYQDNDGLVALIGSSGTLEIAVRNGNAATELGAGIGASVWGRAG
jgi:S-adenosylmethionine hydrolase